VASYRDCFRLLLGFLQDSIGVSPARLSIEDLNATRVVAFLDHLEVERHNSVRTRNARLAAIRSLFRYAALCHPEHAELIARVLAIPQKRFDRGIVSFLTEAEVHALLGAPDRSHWECRRDHAMLCLAVQTGLRVSELVGLNCGDVMLGPGAHVRCFGKGRKERATPLTSILHGAAADDPVEA
jgi:integrase/recombinase XerD